ncbi:MAG: Site-specific recombinase [Candidatus Peregrinibacteria bacterium Greene0416_62]|nr:MAG: Site-specific recombinase [Candidatus Peregrinibacteria bacterium Greene0416_62]
MAPEQAVSILRVSTRKQLDEGDGIENQRRANNDYILRKGYTLTKEVVIAESASLELKERVDLDAALTMIFALRKQKKVDTVVLYKSDRLSRGGGQEYFTIKALLVKHGLRVEYSTEQIDDSASGELLEHVLAGISRFENRQRTDRTIGTEKILTQDGFWCRSAPTGFENARDENNRPILKPTSDTTQWELLCYGLRKQMAGTHTITQVANELRSKGLCTRTYRTRDGQVKRNPMTAQAWTKICRSPLYGGMLRSKWTDGKLIQAKFNGALTPHEWSHLQKVLGLQGKGLVVFPRKKLNPQFPLRRFLRCSHCGSPSTGYPSYNRHGTWYYYYGCRNKACEGFRITAQEGQRAFVAYLKTVTPSKELLELFREIVLEKWDEKYKMLTRESTESHRKIQNLKEQKQALIELMKQNHTNLELVEELRKDFERVSNEYTLATMERDSKETKEVDAEKVINHCIGFLANSYKLWEMCSVEDKYRLQSIIFPDGVTYDGLLGKQALKISLVYAAIQELDALQHCLAAPQGVEPWLTD